MEEDPDSSDHHSKSSKKKTKRKKKDKRKVINETDSGHSHTDNCTKSEAEKADSGHSHTDNRTKSEAEASADLRPVPPSAPSPADHHLGGRAGTRIEETDGTKASASINNTAADHVMRNSIEEAQVPTAPTIEPNPPEGLRPSFKNGGRDGLHLVNEHEPALEKDSSSASAAETQNAAEAQKSSETATPVIDVGVEEVGANEAAPSDPELAVAELFARRRELHFVGERGLQDSSRSIILGTRHLYFPPGHALASKPRNRLLPVFYTAVFVEFLRSKIKARTDTPTTSGFRGISHRLQFKAAFENCFDKAADPDRASKLSGFYLRLDEQTIGLGPQALKDMPPMVGDGENDADFYVSHSMNSDDGQHHWRALQQLSTVFEAEIGRLPRFCFLPLGVDQGDDGVDSGAKLELLRNLILQSKVLLVLHGPDSFGSEGLCRRPRIRCLVEIFVAGLLKSKESMVVMPLFGGVNLSLPSTLDLMRGKVVCKTQEERQLLTQLLGDFPGGLPAIQDYFHDYLWPSLFPRDYCFWGHLKKSVEEGSIEGVERALRHAAPTEFPRAGPQPLGMAVSDHCQTLMKHDEEMRAASLTRMKQVQSLRGLVKSQSMFEPSSDEIEVETEAAREVRETASKTKSMPLVEDEKDRDGRDDEEDLDDNLDADPVLELELELGQGQGQEQEQGQELGSGKEEQVSEETNSSLRKMNAGRRRGTLLQQKLTALEHAKLTDAQEAEAKFEALRSDRQIIDLLLDAGANRVSLMSHPSITTGTLQASEHVLAVLEEILAPEFPCIDVVEFDWTHKGAEFLGELVDQMCDLSTVCGREAGEIDLRLNGNFLSSGILGVLCVEEGLQVLELADNPNVTGDISPLVSLGELVKLDLHGTNLFGNVAALESCPMLCDLDLSNTAAEGSLPNLLRACTQLQSCFLTATKLHGPLEDTLSFCNAMKIIDVRECDLIVGALAFSQASNECSIRFDQDRLASQIPPFSTQFTSITKENDSNLHGSLGAIALCSNFLAQLNLRGCAQTFGPLDPLAHCILLQQIILDGCGVSGTLGPIAECSQLEDLSLANCNLHGDLQPLGNCSSLRRISISRCTKIEGDISPLCKIESLEAVDFELCRVKGSFESLTDSCPNLEHLNAGRTFLFGNLTSHGSIKYLKVDDTEAIATFDVFASCPALEVLSLKSCRNIRGSLEDLKACHALKHLNLDMCPGAEGILFPLEDIETLHVNETRISGELDPLAACTRLSDLNISYANITGTLDAVRTCTALKSLSIEFCNGLSGTMDPLTDCFNMEKFVIFQCAQINGTLNPISSWPRLSHIEVLSMPDLKATLQPFSNCPGLRVLSIQSCAGLEGQMAPLASCALLTSLKLSRTQVSGGFEPLSHCRDLREIRLRDCEQINGYLQPLTVLEQLERVDMQGCPWITGSIDVFARCSKLVEMNFNFCRAVEGTLSFMRRLPLLEICCLSRTKVRGSLTGFRGLYNLKILKLGQTGIQGIMEALGSCTSLVDLDLHGTNLQGPLDPLAMCPALKHVNLADTNVEGNIAPLERCQRLQTLHLDNCQAIKGTLEPLKQSYAIQRLVLNNTQLQGELEAIASCLKLRVLDLRDTFVSDTLEPLMPVLNSMQELLLGHTGIHGTLQALSLGINLKRIDLSRTKVSGPLNALGGCKSLQFLDASYCPLLTGTLYPIKDCSHLQELNFSSCINLTGNVQALQMLPVLRRVRMKDVEGVTGLDVLHELVERCSVSWGASLREATPQADEDEEDDQGTNLMDAVPKEGDSRTVMALSLHQDIRPAV